MLDRTWKMVGKRSGEWEMRNTRGGEMGKVSTYVLGRCVTEFLTKSCMAAYEW